MKFNPSICGQASMHLMIALLIAVAPLPVLAADEHVQVALLSEQDALVPGTTAWLGLRLAHSPHWHTYWTNPGDSGLPTKLAWRLPTGFRAGDIAWPVPQRIDVGGLQNFGYEGDVVLPVPIDVPSAAAPGSTAHLAVTAQWLVCHDECIPGKADLALDLPVRPRAARVSDNAAAFAAARAALPARSATPAQARLHDHDVSVELPSLAPASLRDVFAQSHNVLDNARPRIQAAGAGTTLTFTRSDYAVTLPRTFDLLVLRAHAPALVVPAVVIDSNHP